MKKGYNNKSLLNLKSGTNGTTFSADYQPKKEKKPKPSDIRKLMISFGRTLAPDELRQDPAVKHFLDENGMTGKVNEVLIARLYAAALYTGDLKAMKLILDTLNNKMKGRRAAVMINFISPPLQEPTEDLENDSWTVAQPGESASD